MAFVCESLLHCCKHTHTCCKDLYCRMSLQYFIQHLGVIERVKGRSALGQWFPPIPGYSRQTPEMEKHGVRHCIAKLLYINFPLEYLNIHPLLCKHKCVFFMN